MAADIVMKRNDTNPPLKATLEQVNQSTNVTEAADLKEAVKVTAILKPPVGAAVELVCTGPAAGGIKTATGANAGKVEVYWLQTTLSVLGVWTLEFEAEFPESETGHTGTKVKQFQTFPNAGYRSIEVVADLGSA